MWSLLCPIFLLLAATTTLASIICSDVVYGHPGRADCRQALATIPIPDQYARFFIENPLLVSPQYVNWDAFIDPRPQTLQTQSVQLPKFWGYGSCNIALTTYFQRSATPLTSWSYVYFTGLEAIDICLDAKQGGAVTVNGMNGVPVLSLFFWVNGAAFQDIVNIYTSAGFPRGIDPRYPVRPANGSAGMGNSSSNSSYSAYPQNLDGLNNTLIRLADVAAPVDSS